MKFFAIRRLQIRTNFKNFKFKYNFKLLEKVLENWGCFSKNKSRLNRKLKFYLIEKKYKSKKYFFKNWVKKFQHVFHSKKIETNIEAYFLSKIKLKCFVLLHNYMIKSKNYNLKKLHSKMFYQEKIKKQILGNWNENIRKKKRDLSNQKIIICRERLFTKQVYLVFWKNLFQKINKAKRFYIQKRKEWFFSLLINNAFENRKQNEIATKLFVQKSAPKIFRALKIWFIRCHEKKLIESKTEYLSKLIGNKIKISVLNYFKQKNERRKLVIMQAKNYFSFNVKRKIFSEMNNFIKKKHVLINNAISFQQYQKMKKKKLFLKLWRNSFNNKCFINQSKNVALLFYKKNLRRKLLNFLMNFVLKNFSKKSTKMSLIMKRKKKFLNLWIESYHTQNIIESFQEKIKKSIFLKSFSKIYKNMQTAKKRKSILNYFILQKKNLLFGKLKRFCEERYQTRKKFHAKVQILKLNQSNKIFQRLKCYALIKKKKKEIIKYIRNKRIYQICKLFFDELKNFDHFKTLKDQMIEQFRYKSNLKFLQRLLQNLNKITEKLKIRRQYKEKIINYFQYKTLGQTFNKLKNSVNRNNDSKNQFKFLALAYKSQYNQNFIHE